MTECRRCHGPLSPTLSPLASVAERFVILAFAALHMGLFVGDVFTEATCALCRRRALRWAVPAAFLIIGVMGTFGFVLLTRLASDI